MRILRVCFENLINRTASVSNDNCKEIAPVIYIISTTTLPPILFYGWSATASTPYKQAIPTYLPTYLSIYLPTYLPTFLPIDT